MADGRVYFGSSVEHTINCLDADTGATNWSFFTDGPVRMSPTVQNGKVYAGSDDGNAMVVTATRTYLLADTTLSALNRTTRATIWARSAR